MEIKQLETLKKDFYTKVFSANPNGRFEKITKSGNRFEGTSFIEREYKIPYEFDTFRTKKAKINGTIGAYKFMLIVERIVKKAPHEITLSGIQDFKPTFYKGKADVKQIKNKLKNRIYANVKSGI